MLLPLKTDYKYCTEIETKKFYGMFKIARFEISIIILPGHYFPQNYAEILFLKVE
jgi:hypothetical protein